MIATSAIYTRMVPISASHRISATGSRTLRCSVNEHVFLLRAEGRRLTQNSLYLWLQNPETVSKIRATNANAAQPGINQASVSSLKITIPDPKTARLFDDLVEPLLADAVALAMNAHNLTRMRNMLLPRLIDGQIKLPKAETVA